MVPGLDVLWPSTTTEMRWNENNCSQIPCNAKHSIDIGIYIKQGNGTKVLSTLGRQSLVDACTHSQTKQAWYMIAV